MTNSALSLRNIFCRRLGYGILLLLTCGSALPFVLGNEMGQDNGMMTVTFRNELTEEVVLFYERDDGQRIPQNDGEPIAAKGGELTINSFPGHLFSYAYGGHVHYSEVQAKTDDRQISSIQVLLAGKTEIGVQCTVTANKQVEVLNMRIIPWWSPRGACNFLSLVRSGYYNGAALNRVVPKFLTQFGISSDYETRTHRRSLTILDDPPLEHPIPFVPGMLSYAGSGENSRTTEVFVVMPGTSQQQLAYFGTNPWETPFGVIDNVGQTAVAKWFSYGDMPPWVRFILMGKYNISDITV